MMNKIKTLSATAGAIALALCWPLAVGQMGQTALTQGIAQFNQQNQPIKAKIAHYDRGYLSSDVTTHFTVTDEPLSQRLQANGLPTEFDVRSHLTHGVFSLTAHSELKSVLDLPLTLDTVTRPTGDTQFSVQLGQWHFVSQANPALKARTKEAQITGNWSAKEGLVQYALDVPYLFAALGENEQLTLEKLQGAGERLNGSWLSDSQLELASFNLNHASQNLVLSQVEYRSHLAEGEGGRINNAHRLTIADAHLHAQHLQHVDVEVALNDLDRDAVLMWDKAHREAKTNTAESAGSGITTLFKQGFSVVLKHISLMVDGGGTLSSHGELVIPTGTQVLASNPMNTLLFQSQGESHSQFSAAWIKKYPDLLALNQVSPSALQESKEGDYVLNFSWDKQQLTFDNGDKVPMVSLIVPLILQP